MGTISKATQKKEQDNIITMFDDISSKYDTINSYISFGLERYWRSKSTSLSVEYFQDSKLDVLVDVACGTGKMIKSWTKEFYKNGISCKEIIGIDPSKGMLDIAKEKITNASFMENKADDMPLNSESVDVLSISYGLRNIVDKKSAFIEFNRVLKNGGIIVVLEFVKDESGSIISKLKEGYIQNIIPLYSKLFSDNKDAFVYLGKSIENLQERELRDLFAENGFDLVCLKSFNFGASHTFIAKKVNNISKTNTKAKAKTKTVKTSKKIKKEEPKETVKVTKSDMDISTSVRQVGINLFVEFFETFQDINIENKDVVEIIVKKKKTKVELTKRKVSLARKIIKNNLEKEALEEALKSPKIKVATKNKAKKYLKKIS